MFNSVTRILHRIFPRPRVIVAPAMSTIRLDPRTRLQLDDWLNDPTTKLALSLVEARHPGLHTSRIAKHARSEWDQLAAVNLLNQIAGFEAYRNALLTIADVPKERGDIPETYPNQ